ncbi:hypothetical protein [uncultured Propionivibrio sp.]|uniref:hypothetical protein n=1 Tax=uncultured Propionivibrio sp. TaxID=426737 RepID=UPI0029C01DA3|nr:hypothetical protein [uncultured Propionivibrio sp.]
MPIDQEAANKSVALSLQTGAGIHAHFATALFFRCIGKSGQSPSRSIECLIFYCPNYDMPMYVNAVPAIVTKIRIFETVRNDRSGAIISGEQTRQIAGFGNAAGDGPPSHGAAHSAIATAGSRRP